MDYEQKYKEALGIAKMWHKNMAVPKECKVIFEQMFPELKESYGEKIRKELIEHIKANYEADYVLFKKFPPDDVIAWLEKQGEKKSDSRYKYLEDLLIADDIHQMSMNEAMVEEAKSKAVNALSKLGISVLLGLEKQGEKKPAVDTKVIIPKFRVGDEIKTSNGESLTITKIDEKGYWSEDLFICGFGDSVKWELVDNVEPKFHPGEWIISNTADKDYHICKITGIKDGNYTIESICGYKGYNKFDVFDTVYKLWAIKDANDGDVLYSPEQNLLWVYKNKEECHVAVNLNYANSTSFGTDIVIPSDVCPATKEQRDMFFLKMKEAGYEWDSEKKELKKIEIGSNQVISEIVKNQKEIPSEFTKLVHENFWDLTNKIEPKMLDPDKVIKWLNDQACFGYIEVEVDKLVKQFKKDFDQ